MSRNSKNAQRIRAARARKRAKQEGKIIVSLGPNGPKKTTPKHGKVNRSKYNRADRRGVTIAPTVQTE